MSTKRPIFFMFFKLNLKIVTFYSITIPTQGLKLMYQLDIKRYFRETSLEEQNLLWQSLLDLRESHRNRDACELFVDKIGFSAIPTLDENYYGEVLNYNLGLLAAFSGHPAEAAKYINASNALPGYGDNLSWSDHASNAAVLFDQKEKCKLMGLPSILISSLPKSASASISNAFNQVLQMPVFRLSIGSTPKKFALVPNWLNIFMNGGGISHDHFEASSHNLDILNTAQVKSLFVQVRDPRSAAWSAVQMGNRLKVPHPLGSSDHEAFSQTSLVFGRWIEDWINASADGNINVNWILYSDLSQNFSEVLMAIIARLPEAEKISKAFEHNLTQMEPINMHNHGNADDDAWRQNIPPELALQLWNTMPETVKELLHLEP